MIENLVQLMPTSNSKLNQALDSIKQIAEYINDKQKKMLNSARLRELTKVFGLNPSELLIPGRILVYEEEKIHYSKQNGKKHAAHIVLTNDVLILHKTKATFGNARKRNHMITIRGKNEKERSFSVERQQAGKCLKLSVFTGSKLHLEVNIFTDRIVDWEKHLQEVKGF